nr:MAG TPA: hypothetical protein [Caudoviricetes sp.]
MIVNIGESVYGMPVELFNKTVELALEKNTSRYFIYCLVLQDVYILANDFFDDKEQFLKILRSYVEQGFNVYFVEEGVKCVEQSG